MSVSKWAYTPEVCDGGGCPGDCDLCDKPKVMEDEEDEWCTDCKEYDKERHCCPRWNKVIRNTVDEIKQNADDVRENVKGEWIVGDNSLTCPICGAHGEDIRSDFTFNYCPNCGADMRGEA